MSRLNVIQNVSMFYLWNLTFDTFNSVVPYLWRFIYTLDLDFQQLQNPRGRGGNIRTSDRKWVGARVGTALWTILIEVSHGLPKVSSVEYRDGTLSKALVDRYST